MCIRDSSHTKTVEGGLEKVPDYYKRADTLEELAEMLDVDKDEFLKSVERYNKMCEQGEDTDFYKESHFLYPVKEGPFTACMVAPGLLGVCEMCIRDRGKGLGVGAPVGFDLRLDRR